MENAADALQLAFSILVFMLACGLLFSTVSLAMEVTGDIIKKSDKSEYYEYIADDLTNQKVDDDGNRIVTLEEIIPTLYRYYTESYAVTIIDNGEIVARFDSRTETICEKWQTFSDEEQGAFESELNNLLEDFGVNLENIEDLFKSIYGQAVQQPSVTREFACPWIGNSGYIAKRIDSDLSRHTSKFQFCW